MFMRYNEQGDVVLRDENHQEFVLSADKCAFVEVEGHEEIVKFGKDVIANMKYMNDKEKKVYRVRDRRTNPHHMMSGTLLLT
jgi:DNA helicase IV